MKDLPFLVSKSAQQLLNKTQIFFCHFSKLGPKRAKIGKYTGICMENSQKTSKKLITFSFLLQSS